MNNSDIRQIRQLVENSLSRLIDFQNDIEGSIPKIELKKEKDSGLLNKETLESYEIFISGLA